MALDRGAIVRLDKAYVWHPYTSIDEWEKTEPIVVARAEGAWLEDADGKRYLDGNSSWWVAALGHGHPRLLRVMREQGERLAHCALAGIAHEPSAALAEDLVRIAPPRLKHVFYTDNGSGSVEVAIKIAIQHARQTGAPKRTRFLALEGAFHGDTLGATSLGGVEVFKRPFAGVLFDCVHAPFPAQAMEAICEIVHREKDTLAAVVVESMVQGAAGMRAYRPEHLRQLREVTREAGVLLVLDEVFAGYGRTGPMWAVEHAGITPDVMCIGKAMSAYVPMGATLVTDQVFDAFRGGKENTLYYGHTFCGNPIGAAIAREVLAVYRDEQVLERARPKAKAIADAFAELGRLPGVSNVRSLGMIGAVDLANGGYLGGLGWRVYEEARRRGAYLRPLGDTVYVTPPLNIPDADLDRLLGILRESVRAVLA